MRDVPKGLRLGGIHGLQRGHNLVGLGWEESSCVTISVRRVCSGVERVQGRAQLSVDS